MIFNSIVWFLTGMFVMDVLWAYRTGTLQRVVRRMTGR
jgi:hypothetical protein